MTLPDGRVLAYEEYGVPTGFPVLSNHGGLSSRLDAAPAHEAAVAKGIRLVSPDRPGIGLSTFQPGRRLVDWPADVAHLTDALGMDRFAVMGWSAGGPYAAVCAAKMSDRVTAAALLSSAVPLDLYGTTRGLTVEDRALMFLTRRTPWLASVLMKVSIVNASNARLFRAVMRSFPPADRTVLTEWGPPDHALAFVREAVRQGTEGACRTTGSSGIPGGSRSRRSVCPSTSGRGRTTEPGLRATAPSSSATFPRLRSPWCPTRATSHSWRIRRRPSSTRCSAATTTPSPRRSGTSGRRRARSAWSPGVLQLAPVGHLDGRHDRRADVELDLVVVTQRQVVGVTRVERRLLAGRGEEHRHLPGGGPDLCRAERDAPLVEELAQREARAWCSATRCG